jgi:hypothetical protein
MSTEKLLLTFWAFLSKFSGTQHSSLIAKILMMVGAVSSDKVYLQTTKHPIPEDLSL